MLVVTYHTQEIKDQKQQLDEVQEDSHSYVELEASKQSLEQELAKEREERSKVKAEVATITDKHQALQNQENQSREELASLRTKLKSLEADLNAQQQKTSVSERKISGGLFYLLISSAKLQSFKAYRRSWKR